MKSLSITYKYETLRVRTFWTLLVLILCVLLCYGYLVNKTVLNIVSRQSDQSQLTDLQSQIAELEAKQIELRSQIDEQKAVALGFHEVVEPHYVSVKANAETVSYESSRNVAPATH